jgi:hypothetical protein
MATTGNGRAPVATRTITVVRPTLRRPRAIGLASGVAGLVALACALGLPAGAQGGVPANTARIDGHRSLTTCVSAPCVLVGRWHVPEPSRVASVQVPWQAASFVAMAGRTRVRLPAPFELACPTPSVCVGLVDAASPLVWTRDAGRHWTAQRNPDPPFTPASLSCRTATSCVVLANTAGPPMLWWTTDAGARWHVVQGPLQTAQVSDVDCVSARFCIYDASSYLEPGAAVAWSAGPAAPWRFVPLTREIQTETELVECPSAGACLAAYRTPSSGLIVLASDDAARSWHQIASVSHRVQALQSTTGVDCTSGPQCWIGIRTYASAQNAALYVDPADATSLLEDFPASRFIEPVGGPVCHPGTCVFFVRWHGEPSAATVPATPVTATSIGASR